MTDNRSADGGGGDGQLAGAIDSKGVVLMETINARFEDGVLKPARPLNLPAHAEVRITIELVTPSPLTAGNLPAFLQSLPALGDDDEEFAKDVRAVRAEFPAEANLWD